MRDKIERLHLLDLDVAHGSDTLDYVCDELTLGLLVQHSVLIEAGPGGGWPVVRFTGPRNQLEELLNRYDGVGVFDPHRSNPDAPPAYVAPIGDSTVKMITDKLYG